MGILNVTPDSFSDGGVYMRPVKAVRHALDMVNEGASIIDVGGQSTRPGSKQISVEEERRRILPVIEGIRHKSCIRISIDTTRAPIAEEALDAGADMVNDVSAMRSDPDMVSVVAKSRVPVILMHMRGTPETMQRAPRYSNVVTDVCLFLKQRAEFAMQQGIKRNRIFLDPGIGFGKTVRHNLALVRSLRDIMSLGYPLVLGASRKSFIGRTLGLNVQDRLSGSLACVASAYEQGVHIVRAHDVRQTCELINMLHAIEKSECV